MAELHEVNANIPDIIYYKRTLIKMIGKNLESSFVNKNPESQIDRTLIKDKFLKEENCTFWAKFLA